ncbi:unnamed protein product [Lupinus luteus]|uniref:Uncharacterized protein n=1 Tax=Lupinus luteus TaxID=3873 RepID=A0AAV1YIS3_LUPLU
MLYLSRSTLIVRKLALESESGEASKAKSQPTKALVSDSRAVAQFYPTLGGNGGLGGMNGGINPPPAPENYSLLAAAAAASTEAGPSASEPNSHVLSEAQHRNA